MNSQTDKSTEIELAWLVKKLPDDLDTSTGIKIKQGYLPHTDPEIKDIRVREKGNKYTYTVKKFLKSNKETGFSSEETKNLSEEEFEELWQKAEKKTTKMRFLYSLSGGLIAEIDVYKNNLAGLIVVEVEFPDFDVCKSFKLPDWFGKEVTDSKGIYPPVIADMSIEEVNKMNEEYIQAPHDFG